MEERRNSRDRRNYILPGPNDPSLLYAQADHRSEAIWQGSMEVGAIACRRTGTILHLDDIPDRIIPYLRRTGFYGVIRLGYFALDWQLISALVERWRPETHTFMFPEGEMTITLQDVGLITGLPVDGAAVTGRSRHHWPSLCEALLGVVPPNSALRGCYLKMVWLAEEFSQLPNDPDEEVVQRFARAYIMRAIGSIFSDTSASRVNIMFLSLLADLDEAGNYSWGGACLAWLYRQLCKATNPEVMQMAGPLFILQIWAWDRITAVSPTLSVRVPHHDAPLGSRWSNARHITEVITHVLVELRYQLDRLLPEQVIWEPYNDALIESLPEDCRQGRQIWRAVVPLVCFHIIEWHQPDRVMRQFGMQQHIPAEPQQSAALHDIDLRKSDTNWAEVHSHWIARWNTRDRRIITAPPATGPLHFHSEYMEWYRRVSRRWISVRGAALGSGEDGLEHMQAMATNPTTGSMASICDLLQSVSFCMMEERRQTQLPAPHPAPAPPHITTDPDDPPIPDSVSRGSRGRNRGHGRGRRRDHPKIVERDSDVHPVPPPIQYHQSQAEYEHAPSSSNVPPMSSQIPSMYYPSQSQFMGWTPGSNTMPSFTPGAYGVPFTPIGSMFPAFPPEPAHDTSTSRI
ncbi:serine/threonine-protein phosphatase 7 long form homolog [Manihot esculenta]|uniref:serine/threonine-protein phosphatase 7 long form homolog n=1 Tax=Manihot esculenta TaxID=3983 RepID=UPI001CC67755|nr:serine/threonine-protein phosphatase 7 long form homolog [Manihot esculenta]